MLIYKYVSSVLIGYLIGSIPVAVLVSRHRHVNIFTTGTGLAGAANVFRNVGHIQGILVFAGDLIKGMLAIMIAHRMGLEGASILIAALATLGGHWNSVFTRFRGGDGVSTLLGITLAVMPMYGIITIVIGIVIAAVARRIGQHGSLWGGSVTYGLILFAVLPFSDGSIFLGLGVVFLAVLVLAHGIIGYRRRINSL